MERKRLEKERLHYATVLETLVAKGDEEAAARLRAQLTDVERAIEDVDYRAANVRAGYVYVISNIGAFGERMVKVGMTRIEGRLHERLAGRRVNRVNLRREFFYATPQEVKAHLAELAGELLTYEEMAEALEYHQSVNQVPTAASAPPAAS